jgi:hypothetical protein
MSNYPYTSYPSRPAGSGGPPPSGKRGLPWWGWLLVIGGGVTILLCAGVIGLVSYIAAKGPETKAYTGTELPAKYLAVANDLSLLEPGEQIRFFYSDALTDIKEGFYFVSDRKVVVYIADAAVPATKVPFTKIAAAEIERSDSTFEDSTITLKLTDDSVVSFPISIEMDRDKMVHETIQRSIKRVATPKSPAQTPPRK